MICQQYVSKPFLIDGFKFDLRIYILISSCDPLRIFVYKDGLARFATVQYNEPSNNNTVSSLIKKLASLMVISSIYIILSSVFYGMSLCPNMSQRALEG